MQQTTVKSDSLKEKYTPQPLSKGGRWLLASLSCALVAFGQPAAFWWLGLIASACGYSLFWRVLLDVPAAKQRFGMATLWFAAVQLVQIHWMLSHPYSYIYAVYFSFSLLLGLQYGVFALGVTADNCKRLLPVLGMAGLWTLLEWSRLYFLSGYTWNPVGLALTGSFYALQFVSLWGIFGLSFWVIMVNGMALRAWLLWPRKLPAGLWLTCAAVPYAFGWVHFAIHDAASQRHAAENSDAALQAVLVQTAFPAEEAIPFTDKRSYIAFVLEEWQKILTITKKHVGKKIDLLALPEYVVPFGTYTFLYPYTVVSETLQQTFGKEVTAHFPPLEEPFARRYETEQGDVWLVNNAFWVQALANIFQTGVVAGLEDADELEDGKLAYYSAAIYFAPNVTADSFSPCRYAKRVLLPMAEYIPSAWCRNLAASYGIQGSFTCGEEATLFQEGKVPFGASICYEETFGDLMRESRQQGAQMLVNLSSDVWYPNSLLPRQHFDHGHLRAVENGIPILRACNTGITCAIDSLGRTVAMLGEGNAESEWLADSLEVSLPTYHYATLYSRFGDGLILSASLCFLVLWGATTCFKRKI